MQINDEQEFNKAITAQAKLYKMWKEGELSFHKGKISEITPRAAKVLCDYNERPETLCISELDSLYDLLTTGIKEYLLQIRDITLLKSKYRANNSGTVPFDELLHGLMFFHKI